MNIEQELHQWLDKNIPERHKEKSRNIQIVLNFYGFGDLPAPTMEILAKQFSIGSRERIRQVINDSFRKVVNLSQLPIARSAFDVIEQKTVISVPEIRNDLIKHGLASEETTVKGLLNLYNGPRNLNQLLRYI